MHVIAAPGLRVPREDDPRKHIDEHTAQDVPETSYYQRRVAAGELLTAPEPATDEAQGSAKRNAKRTEKPE
ncbi:hypothetical protein D3C76_300680 [compost metagenome]